jgi:competence protein ComEC
MMVRIRSAVGAAVALLIGVLSVQWLPFLPSRWWCMLGAMSLVVSGWRWPHWRWCSWAAFGFAWAVWHATTAMDARLPKEWEGRDFQVIGTIAGLPQAGADATGFRLAIEQATLDGKPVALHGRLRLAWYRTAQRLEPCSRWQFVLRLKRPRGLVNPGGADSERSALERGIVATGYVRDGSANKQLDTQAFCIDGVRDAIVRGIAERVRDPHDAALLQAFSVGDIRGLSQRDWEVARANGIPHLIAISGFHVGVAAVSGIWLASFIYLLWPALALRVPCIQAKAAMALAVASAYGALAGFGLPTVRTLLMIAVVAWARCSRRQSSGAQSLALALIAILLVDPLAVLAAGFWLSFVGVAFLIFGLTAGGRGLRGFLRELSAGQLLMTLSLLPLTVWFFGESSLVGVLSNLIAVPFVSFVIVPGALLGMLLLGVCPPLATPVLWLTGWLAHAQWWLFERMALWPGAHWYLPEVQPWALCLATFGAWWLFMPRGVPLRGLGLLLFLPLVWPPLPVPQHGAFQLWVLDVGQGLSVLLRTRQHALVYDTGARYPSDFDLGEAAVLPSMRALGIDRLDVLMVSHADNDHAGGASAIAAAFPAATRYAGEPERMPMPMEPCESGQQWEWDGVRFRVLFPEAGKNRGKGNDRSCVLLIEGIGGRVLLTGDISSKVEAQVAAAVGEGEAPVLLVPHHGSRTSSSAAFIARLRPPLAIVSAGWRNRFSHPHPHVVQRYAEAGVPLWNTAESGAIQLDVTVDGVPTVKETWRQRQARYWRE